MTEDVRHALPKGYEIEGYRIEKVLGAGGFGITYLAHEIVINRKVAIKEYLPNGIAARGRDDISVHPISAGERENFQWGLERFRQEAKTLVTFRHPNIVTVYRYFEANGTAFLVMAYEDGESLARILDRAGTLSENEVNEILWPLLGGLEHVHKSGFLHRDIKPGNIYIRRDGSPVLLDFGAARQALGERSQSLTSIVSAGYAPFEQYTTRGNQGPWTDIYAFGGVLYRCITGERPPDSPDRIRDDPYMPAVRAAEGKYDAALLQAIDVALRVDEKHRPQSIAEWRALLEGRDPMVAPPPAHTMAETLAARVAGPSARHSTRAAPAGRPPAPWSPSGADRTVPPRARRGTALAVGVIVGGLVLLGAAGAGAYIYIDRRDHAAATEYLVKARAAIASGSLDEAERHVNEAARIKPSVRDLDQVKEALKAAREAKLAQARRFLAQARDAIRRRDWSAAERHIANAEKLAPNHPEVAAVRAELAAARSAATDAERLRSLFDEIRDAIARKDFATARRKLEEAEKAAPNDPMIPRLRTQLTEAEERDRRGDPPPGDRTAMPSIVKSPIRMCQPGSIRYINATRTLAFHGDRYCSTPDWHVREAATDGTRLYWRVIFSDGYVGCQCLRTGATTDPPKTDPPKTDPPKTDPPRADRTAIPNVSRTPNHLCVAGSQRMVQTTRPLTQPSRNYCTDDGWQVDQVETDGTTVYWRVPFPNGAVSCACRKR